MKATEAEKVVAQMAQAGVRITLDEALQFLDASYGRIPQSRAQAVLDEFQWKLIPPLQKLLGPVDPVPAKTEAVRSVHAARLKGLYGDPWIEDLDCFLHRTKLTRVDVRAITPAELMRYAIPLADAEEAAWQERDEDDTLWKLAPVARRVGFSNLIEDEAEFCHRTGLTHADIVRMTEEELAQYA